MKKRNDMLALLLILAMALFAGCGGSSSNVPLSAANINLIFVASEDLTFNAPGDVDPDTANLTNQGLQRSLLMATALKQQVLGNNNATSIYALEPMTHLQTANNYPDMAALEGIQQFALLNQVTLYFDSVPVQANSYPVNTSYAANAVPSGVAPQLVSCIACQGIDFSDANGDNETLASSIIGAGVPGYYVFSAPWETIHSLLTNITKLKNYNLIVPKNYPGPNFVYAISILPSGSASLVTFDAHLDPPSTYPELPSPIPISTECKEQTPFSITVTGGSGGAIIPGGINTNETIYFVRHAEAHPGVFDDGNYVCAGQWRALDLPNALRGKISPDEVYSIDPAQIIAGTADAAGNSNWSYVRPSLTVLPYAIANGLPFNLVAGLEIFAQNPPELATQASAFFFSDGGFSNRTVLVGWEHEHIPITVNALIASYFPNGGGPTAPNWPTDDFDTIWTVTLDPAGNLTVDNTKCEGINSAALPEKCPQF